MRYFSVAAAFVLGLTALSSSAAGEPTFRVQVDKENSELVFTLAPVHLPAGGHDAITQPPAQVVELPITAFLHGFTVDLLDENGKPLPSVLLHHINIMQPHRRELFSNIMQRIGAAGAETGTVSLPRLIGVPIQRGDTLLFTIMFDNPTGEHYDHVELRVRMKYSSAGSLLPTIPVQPFYLDVMPPAGYHVFALPPGKSSRSWEGKPALPGRVLALGGHLHKYGTLLRFEDVTAGKVIWEAKPVLDADGNVEAMPRKFFLTRLGVQLDPTHVYRVTAEYDNPTGQVIEHGAMGTLGGVMVPDDRATWPAADRDHPDYVADLGIIYAKPEAEAHHHH